MRDATTVVGALLLLVLAAVPAAAQERTDSAAVDALRMEIRGQARVPQLLTVRPRDGFTPELTLLEAAEQLDPGIVGVPRSLGPGFIPVVDPVTYRHILREIREGTTDAEAAGAAPLGRAPVRAQRVKGVRDDD